MTYDMDFISHFPEILKDKILKEEFKFPYNTEYRYESVNAYRCYYRSDGDERPVNRDDFRSYAEMGKVLRGNSCKKAEYYGTSLFTSKDMLDNIKALNKPEKHVAYGRVYCDGGPMLQNFNRNHICWWMFEDLDLSSYNEVIDSE